MVECEECEEWFHLKCMGLTQAPERDELWYCRRCVHYCYCSCYNCILLFNCLLLISVMMLFILVLQCIICNLSNYNLEFTDGLAPSYIVVLYLLFSSVQIYLRGPKSLKGPHITRVVGPPRPHITRTPVFRATGTP